MHSPVTTAIFSRNYINRLATIHKTGFPMAAPNCWWQMSWNVKCWSKRTPFVEVCLQLCQMLKVDSSCSLSRMISRPSSSEDMPITWTRMREPTGSVTLMIVWSSLGVTKNHCDTSDFFHQHYQSEEASRHVSQWNFTGKFQLFAEWDFVCANNLYQTDEPI